MSFPTYTSYRDSGIEWIGEVPIDWEVAPLKAAFSVVGGATPKSDVTDYWDGGIPWITPGDLSRLETPFIGETIRTISEEGLAYCAATRIPAGSVILSTRAPIGSLGITTEPATTNQGCKALVPKRDASPHFLFYTLSIATTELNVRGKGTTFLELSGDELAKFKMPLPTLPVQTAITAFLDRETGKIDALVEAQRQLIDLLKEKRQAVISHAVTKGLDPAAPMKDSGVEWLGKVPTHWNVVPTRSLLARRRELVGSQHARFQLLSLTLGGIVVRDRDSGHGKFPAEFDTYQSVEPNDLVFCLFDMDETPRTVGLSSHAGMVTGAYDVFTAKSAELGEYVFWLFLSRDFRKELKPFYTGLRKVVRKDTFGSIPVALPPASERAEIINHLRNVTRQLDQLSAEATNAIALLQERRAALISAAVTGKMDVRGLAPEQVEAA